MHFIIAADFQFTWTMQIQTVKINFIILVVSSSAFVISNFVFIISNSIH